VTSPNGTRPRATFDLSAARAAASDAQGEPFAFTFADEPFEVPPLTTWPLAVSELLMDGDLAGGLRALLGDDQWQRFRALSPTMGDVQRLFEAIAPWAGVENLGNSSAPLPPVSTPT
jgi:hypothetical protein